MAGRVALVTGGESGIGRAIVLALASAGDAVGFTYLADRDLATETQRAVAAAAGRSTGLPCDVGDETAVAEFVAAVAGKFGAPTVLVNCAGVNVRGKTVAELSLAEWEATLRTNLTGPFNMVRAFLHHVPGGGPGKIVNVSSVHEEMPAWRVAEYSAAKGGLRNLTRCLALELAPRKINVNNVAPGTVLTQMVQELLDDPQTLREHEATIPWGRGGTPEDIARAVRFLASGDADYITGTTLVVDGGMILNVDTGSASDSGA